MYKSGTQEMKHSYLFVEPIGAVHLAHVLADQLALNVCTGHERLALIGRSMFDQTLRHSLNRVSTTSTWNGRNYNLRLAILSNQN